MYYIDNIIIIEYLKVIAITDMSKQISKCPEVIHNLTSGLIYLDDGSTSSSASGRGKNKKNVQLWIGEDKTHGPTQVKNPRAGQGLFLALGLEVLLNFGNLYLSLGMKVSQIFEYGEEIMDLHI